MKDTKDTLETHAHILAETISVYATDNQLHPLKIKATSGPGGTVVKLKQEAEAALGASFDPVLEAEIAEGAGLEEQLEKQTRLAKMWEGIADRLGEHLGKQICKASGMDEEATADYLATASPDRLEADAETALELIEPGGEDELRNTLARLVSKLRGDDERSAFIYLLSADKDGVLEDARKLEGKISPLGHCVRVNFLGQKTQVHGRAFVVEG
jgi:hypothetical protein